ncbi:hypothetical protein RRG08_028667 [Elysia crispata]|uniref:Uncharacterized protein n=1 Tax=Elysia crispata TaxID=231223 RepID=A0AAE0ZBQ5_9GAST|nr:hypothetical protein RRG08_028667 [Elysia crispata]
MGHLGVIAFVNKPEIVTGICRSTVTSWQPVPVNQLQSVRLVEKTGSALYKAPKLNSLELCILQHSSGSSRYPNWYRHKISGEQRDNILQDEKSAASAKGKILFSDEMRGVEKCWLV